MTTFLGKLGTQAENVYHAASYINPIPWTRSFYSAVTDYAVLPTTQWIWTKLEKQSSVAEQPEELPKRSKRCTKGADCLVQPVIFISRKAKEFLQPESLYKVCRTIKRMTYPSAHSKPVKIPEQSNRFGKIMGYTSEGVDKVGIQASRTLYVIADVGEKTFAVRLFAGDMASQLRPSLKEHFVEPVFADLNQLIAPKKNPENLVELISYLARSIGGEIVESKGVAFVDQYLAAQEKLITAKVEKIEDAARTQAISWFSNAILREGLNSFVTPALVWGLLSAPGYVVEVVALTQNASGYLETVRTAAYVISYLKYVNYLMWGMNAGRSIYRLHQSYTPEFNSKAMELLRKSLTRRNDLDTAPENDFDPTKEIREYPVVVDKQYDLSGLIQQMKEKTGLSDLITEGKDSASLQYLQRHVGNFTNDIKDKSEKTLRKYDLIESPIVEEVFDDELSDKFVDGPEVETFYDCKSPDDLPPPAPKEDLKSSVVSDAKAVVSLVKDVFDIVTSSSAPTTSPDSSSIASTDPKKVDDTKTSPPPKLSWVKRIAAIVVRIAGAILTFLRKLSPSFLSRFSGIFPGNSSVKSNATTLFRNFTAK